MKAIRNVLLGAAGLVVASLPANATSSTAVGDTPALNSTKSMQLAQRSENPGGAGFRNENPGAPASRKRSRRRR